MNPSLRPVYLVLCAIAVAVAAPAAGAQQAPPALDTTPQTLPFSQNWTDIGMITANDNWTGVPGIEGYLGQDITTTTGTDPQTLLGTSVVVNDLTVLANQTATTVTNGDVGEFHTTSQAGEPGTNPTIALQGSGTADAPYVVLNVNTTGSSGINIAYNVRDIDCTADNSIQQVALQYRVGNTGNFTNLPAGYVADATTGGSLCTLVTPVSVTLPVAADNQPLVQIRVMTTNAVGNDEWVGIDDIVVSGAAAGTTVTQQLGQNAGPGNDAGWRMLSAPLQAMTVGHLVVQNLVQGIPGEYPAAGSNIRTAYDGTGTTTGFLSPASDAAALEAGKGFIWYLYDLTLDPDPGNTTGQSESFELPSPLSATGTPVATTGTYVPSPFPGRPAGDAFYLLGNPYAQAFDLNGIGVSSGTLSTSFSFYNPAISNYVIRQANLLDDVPPPPPPPPLGGGPSPEADDVATWQGFFAQVTGVTANTPLTVTYTGSFARITTPTFYGRPAAAVSMAGTQDVHLTLDGVLDSGTTTTDVAAFVRFNDGATLGWDADDFSKQLPPVTDYALIAPVGLGYEGGVELKAVESRASLQGSTSVPVAFMASGAGTFTLAVDLALLPADWQVRLTDALTGATADLRAGAYTFTAEAGDWTERFTLTIASATTAGEGGAAAFALTAVSPNPAAGRASLTLTTTASERVTAEVFDALGRRVTTIYDGQVSAGASTALVVETGALAPGAYVVRVSGETFTESRRLTVVR